MYNCEECNGKLDVDPFARLGEVTQGVLKSLHKAATNAFPQTTSNALKPGRVIQNSQYDEEWCDTRIISQQKELGEFVQTNKQEQYSNASI